MSGRPTAVSSFTNDSGYITSSGSCASATYATSSGSTTYISPQSYTPTNDTIGGHKAGLVNWMNTNGNNGIGNHVIVSASVIGQWGDNSKTAYPSSVYAMIKIGGGYNGSTYGQWLLSGYDDNRVGVVGRTGNDWTNLNWIAYTSDIPSSLPASDVYAWAKAVSKPSYTYSEVGAAASSHSHSISDCTWRGGVNLTPTASGNGQEWSIDLNPGSYTGTYWHVWSSKLSRSIFCCYPDDCHVTIPNGTLTVSSTVTCSAAYATSDRHVKKDIQEIDRSSLGDLFDTSDKLLKKYTLKTTGKASYGFIAQELEQYIPEAVIESHNSPKAVNYDVAYAKIIASLIYEIKRQGQEIENLKKELNK